MRVVPSRRFEAAAAKAVLRSSRLFILSSWRCVRCEKRNFGTIGRDCNSCTKIALRVRKCSKIGWYVGRVAQLGEHLLCKHAFISPKSLNRRLFTVQTPLQIGLLIGLQKVRVLWGSLKHGGLDARKSIRAVSLRAKPTGFAKRTPSPHRLGRG